MASRPVRWEHLPALLGALSLALVLPAWSGSRAPNAGVRGQASGARAAGTLRMATWQQWSPRPELAPAFQRTPDDGPGGGEMLALRGAENPAAVGAWQREVTGIRPGAVYRFQVWRRTEGMETPTRSATARLIWLDAQNRPARPADYVLEGRVEAGWTLLEQVSAAPEKAVACRVELGLAWAPQGTVWWHRLSLAEESAARGRSVRALTVYHRPQSTGSAAKSVEQFCELLERAADRRPDVICLPEGITIIGTGKSYPEVAESIPGPTTRRLGEVARRLNSYLCAGIYERDGKVLYNTAVLLDRKGDLVGRYRKTHLPREEVEGGLTPGNEYPVFRTDFGKVGLMICWDLQFPEPARALALRGAEVILLPIWGGSELLARARAIENHVFLVTSSYDMKTFIVDPKGDVAAEATRSQPVAVAELNLDQKIVQPWIGDMKARTWSERRGDLPVEPQKDRR